MKITTLNCENLFLSSEDLPNIGTHCYLKDKKKTQKLANAILDIDSDIFCLQEVGGEQSLKILCDDYLKSLYSYALIEGNSNRNIHIAYLIKSSLKLKYSLVSNKEKFLDFSYQKGQKNELLSRDILELRIFNDKKPHLILLGIHLKSQLDIDGIDQKGVKRRSAEMKLLTKRCLSLKNEFQNCPQVILGDFNNIFNEDRDEFRDFKNSCSGFVDILELLNINLSDRGTHIYFNNLGERFIQQLDYILVDAQLHSKISLKTGGIHIFKDRDNHTYPLPETNLQQYVMPSDHFPLTCELTVS